MVWVRTLRAQTIWFVERGFERLGLGHRTVVSRGVHTKVVVFAREVILLDAVWEVLVFGIFSQPLFGASVFTLYSLSWLIVALHLLIRQVPIQVPVSSTASPYFLLVAINEATLFRCLFSLIWLGRLWTHSMRRWCIYLEPPPHRTPTWVPSHSPFLLGAFWRPPLMTCHSSLRSLGMPRTGSSSAASLGYLVFPYSSSETTLLGTPSSARALDPSGKWAGS